MNVILKEENARIEIIICKIYHYLILALYFSSSTKNEGLTSFNSIKTLSFTD